MSSHANKKDMMCFGYALRYLKTNDRDNFFSFNYSRAYLSSGAVIVNKSTSKIIIASNCLESARPLRFGKTQNRI